MTRKPVNEVPSVRDAMWAAIRAFPDGKPFTIREITTAASCSRQTARSYLRGLTAAGFLVTVPTAPGAALEWRLEKDCGIEAPRLREDGSPTVNGTVKEQLWRGMYILKEFTAAELVQTASILIEERTARTYCKDLFAAGYLRVIKAAEGRKGKLARYRLVRNNGPRAPQVQRARQIFDPNSHEVFTMGAGR
jgi:hypothetical protein